MKIALVISSLSTGGAEKVLVNMANYWADRGGDITLITLEDTGAPSFYKMNKSVIIVGIGGQARSVNTLQAVVNNIKRVISFRLALKKVNADVIISFMTETNVLTIIACVGLFKGVIVSERINPWLYPDRKIWVWLRRIFYPFAAKVVTQTKGSAKYFSWIKPENLEIIPNPVIIYSHDLESDSQEINSRKYVVGIGRLVNQKGFDLLLRAFDKIRYKHKEWSLVIYGEGPMRKSLEKLRDDLNLDGIARFPGLTKYSSKVLRTADLFVLSSRYEGFPNVLCEAMACGLPVISYDCEYGPSEIIHHDIDGLLLPPDNVDALAKSMDILMSDDRYRERLGQAAKQIVTRFGEKSVMKLWDKLLQENIKKKTA